MDRRSEDSTFDFQHFKICVSDPEQDWTNVESIRERVIGNHAWYWDIVIADVNADGRDDVIVSTYA